MTDDYAVVSKSTNKVVNVVVWDGMDADKYFGNDVRLVRINPANVPGPGWDYSPSTGLFSTVPVEITYVE